MNEETEYVRATGVVEQIKLCPKCKSSFRTAPDDSDAMCPYCVASSRDNALDASNMNLGTSSKK